MMVARICLAVLLLAVSSLHAAEPSFGPVIDGYGPTYPINDRDVPLEEGFVYRAVFDAANNPDEKSLNTRLVSVAPLVSMCLRVFPPGLSRREGC